MKILITGANGLLGQKIVARCIKNNFPFLATSQGENRNMDCPVENYLSMDVTKPLEIEKVISDFFPTHIIHTAAITNVDYCELNPEECATVNTTAVKFLFDKSKQINAHFQLLSTDFVFDGKKGNYVEEDPVGPLSVYAESKVKAEDILLNDSFKNWSIVRTIIVYGIGNNLSRSNIVCWAKSTLSKGEPMNIVEDQYRAPTWADDLAWACITICKLNKSGIFHISGPDTMSIYEIVERIAKYYNFSTHNLHKVKSTELNQPAKRPPLTGFDISKAKRELGYSPKTLEESLNWI